MKVENLKQWFINDLLSYVVQSGKFAENEERQTFEKCEFEDIDNYVSNFASAPSFATLKLRTPLGIISRDILIKFQCQDSTVRDKMKTIPLFSNEVIMYNDLYPNFIEFLKSCGQNENFIAQVMPKCYFASHGDGDPEKAILILEDLRHKGFRLSDSPVNLDLKHCLISVEKLARFHSVSFAMKFKGWKPFEKFKTSFSEIWLGEDSVCREQCEDFQGYVSLRAIDYLSQKESEVPTEYLENLRQILKSVFDLLKNLAAPQEPLSVIRHGDFNRNNILYKYANGEPVDAKLIDYQMATYGSPSLDLGFLIYMNTTLEFREQHFERIFDYYYSNLIKDISLILNEDEKSISDRIPLEALKEDFGRVAIWHYTIASFFLPIMMSPPDSDFESDLKCKTFKEMGEKNYKMGGDVVSKRISEIIVDFYRRKFYT